MNIWKMRPTLEMLAGMGKNNMVSHLGIQFIEIGDDFLKAEMAVDARTMQPFGIMHGGASCVLAETVASVAASYCIDITIQLCVGTEINTSHVRSIRSGKVIATAKPLHLGRSTQLWEIQVMNEEQQLISISRLRMAIIEKGV